MLVLTRKLGERILIGESVVVTILDVNRWHIRLGIDAPPDIHIRREELSPFPEEPVSPEM